MNNTVGIARNNFVSSPNDIAAMMGDQPSPIADTAQIGGRASSRIPLGNPLAGRLNDSGMISNDEDRFGGARRNLRAQLPAAGASRLHQAGRPLSAIFEQSAANDNQPARPSARPGRSSGIECACPSLPSCPTLPAATRTYIYTAITIAGCAALGVGTYIGFKYLFQKSSSIGLG